jgi:hypothetical protein
MLLKGQKPYEAKTEQPGRQKNSAVEIGPEQTDCFQAAVKLDLQLQ